MPLQKKKKGSGGKARGKRREKITHGWLYEAKGAEQALSVEGMSAKEVEGVLQQLAKQ